LVLAVLILSPQKVATDLLLFLVQGQSPILLLQAEQLLRWAAAAAALMVHLALMQTPQDKTVALAAALLQAKQQFRLAARQRLGKVMLVAAAALTSLDLSVVAAVAVLVQLVQIQYLAWLVVGARGPHQALPDRLLLTLAAVAVGLPAAVQQEAVDLVAVALVLTALRLLGLLGLMVWAAVVEALGITAHRSQQGKVVTVL
jgi:hypothetical protein